MKHEPIIHYYRKVQDKNGNYIFDSKVLDGQALIIFNKMNPYVKNKCFSFGYSPAEVSQKMDDYFTAKDNIELPFNNTDPFSYVREKMFVPVVSLRSGFIIDIYYK